MLNKRGKSFRPLVAEVLKIKTNKDWVGDFDQSFTPGDRVSEEIALHFGEVVAPTTAEEHFIQCGEATDQINGKFTFATFTEDGTSWIYCGNCYEGEKEEPEVIENGEQF